MVRTDFPKFIIVDVTYGAMDILNRGSMLIAPRHDTWRSRGYRLVSDQRIAIPYENDGNYGASTTMTNDMDRSHQSVTFSIINPSNAKYRF